MVDDTNAISPTSTDELLAEVSQYWANYNGSNLWQLIDVLNKPMTDISATAQQVENYREINVASGSTLDLFGEDFKASRVNHDDELYRFLIYIKSLVAKSQGTVPSIVNISETALQKKQGVKVFQNGVRHIIIQIPLSKVDSLKTERLILENLKELVALGIWLDKISFDTRTDALQYLGATTTITEKVNLVAE
ncbi:hypothetical protein H3U50_08165 [Lactobacillus sp. M0398]|uniref:DUF2612 domain-containing protein n=1 Tax=unclassified Lactobacillus TaxID=2620435 RepID=UPI0018DB6921|nr:MULTISPECIES: DUF2612 domain-containing protein [unclassified Lactobacillus]MBI0121770.1 hypothetical protein [Lactobacillus sp. M0398]MBI0122135.1 hypothetical protein [Lactobacillus sp. W8174]MBI0134801.1 hypothetical protein [Lactobacillus sp. W8173]